MGFKNRSKIIVKNHIDLKDMPITVPVAAVVDNFVRLRNDESVSDFSISISDDIKETSMVDVSKKLLSRLIV